MLSIAFCNKASIQGEKTILAVGTVPALCAILYDSLGKQQVF